MINKDLIYSEEMKKVLFVIRELAGGGAERALSNIVMHFPKEWEIDILMNNKDYVEYPYCGNILTLNIPEPKDRNSVLYQARVILKRTHILRRIKKNNDYDACISFMDSSNIANILSGNKYCKTIISVRVQLGKDNSFTYQYIVKPMAKIFYNRADSVVAVSQGIQKELIDMIKIDKDKVHTITNGYDVEEIQHMAEQQSDNQIYHMLKNKFVYITSGRYSYQKAQWHLIRAFSKVASQCLDAHLVLMGKGEDEKYLRDLIISMQLEDRVTLLPFQKNPFAWLHVADVFVMPSMFEGYCNALCEALVCGLPCIATDFQSSAREILAPDTDVTYQIKEGIEYAKYGILTPVCSGKRHNENEVLEPAEEYLAQAMIKLHTDDKGIFMYYKKVAKERGLQLDINKKVQEWIELIEEQESVK